MQFIPPLAPLVLVKMTEVGITQEPVELYKILKFEGLASSGAEAKQFIEQGLVKVNGLVESRKRKKMFAGDVIEFESEVLTLFLEK